jgi:hypothetical protein
VAWKCLACGLTCWCQRIAEPPDRLSQSFVPHRKQSIEHGSSLPPIQEWSPTDSHRWQNGNSVAAIGAANRTSASNCADDEFASDVAEAFVPPHIGIKKTLCRREMKRRAVFAEQLPRQEDAAHRQVGSQRTGPIDKQDLLGTSTERELQSSGTQEWAYSSSSRWYRRCTAKAYVEASVRRPVPGTVAGPHEG